MTDKYASLVASYGRGDKAVDAEVLRLVSQQDRLLFDAAVCGLRGSEAGVSECCRGVLEAFVREGKRLPQLRPPQSREELVRALRVLQCQGQQARSNANVIYSQVLSQSNGGDAFGEMDSLAAPVGQICLQLEKIAKRQVDILQLLVSGSKFSQELTEANLAFLARELSDATVVRDQEVSQKSLQFGDDFLALLAELLSSAEIGLGVENSKEKEAKNKALKAERERIETSFLENEAAVCDAENEAHLLAEHLVHIQRQKAALAQENRQLQLALDAMRALVGNTDAGDRAGSPGTEIEARLAAQRYGEIREEFSRHAESACGKAPQARESSRAQEELLRGAERLQGDVASRVGSAVAEARFPGHLQRIIRQVTPTPKAPGELPQLGLAPRLREAQQKAQAGLKALQEILETAADGDSGAASVFSCLGDELREVGYALQARAAMLKPELLDECYLGVDPGLDTRELDALILLAQKASQELASLQSALQLKANEALALQEQNARLLQAQTKQAEKEPSLDEITQMVTELQKAAADLADREAAIQMAEFERKVATVFVVPPDAMGLLQSAEKYRLCKKCGRAPFCWVSTQQNLCHACKNLPEFAQEQFLFCTVGQE